MPQLPGSQPTKPQDLGEQRPPGTDPASPDAVPTDAAPQSPGAEPAPWRNLPRPDASAWIPTAQQAQQLAAQAQQAQPAVAQQAPAQQYPPAQQVPAAQQDATQQYPVQQQHAASQPPASQASPTQAPTEQIPATQYPAPQYPTAQQYPNQQYSGKTAPTQQYPTQQYAPNQFPTATYAGSPTTGAQPQVPQQPGAPISQAPQPPQTPQASKKSRRLGGGVIAIIVVAAVVVLAAIGVTVWALVLRDRGDESAANIPTGQGTLGSGDADIVFDAEESEPVKEKPKKEEKEESSATSECTPPIPGAYECAGGAIPADAKALTVYDMDYGGEWASLQDPSGNIMCDIYGKDWGNGGTITCYVPSWPQDLNPYDEDVGGAPVAVMGPIGFPQYSAMTDVLLGFSSGSFEGNTLPYGSVWYFEDFVVASEKNGITFWNAESGYGALIDSDGMETFGPQ